MRATALFVLAGACAAPGCRSSFESVPDAAPGIDAAPADAPPDPILEVTENATETIVSVPGRFALRFEESRNWQPQRWTDESRGDIDLSGTGTTAESGSLMTPLILCSMGACVGANSMAEPTLGVLEQNDRSVTLRMSWSWTLNATQISGESSYTIDVDGLWTAEATVTNGGNTLITGSMEIADTHINISLPWEATADLAGTRFSFGLPSDGTFVALAFEVELESPPSATISSDELNNRYFVTPLDLAASGSQSARWTARLWR